MKINELTKGCSQLDRKLILKKKKSPKSLLIDYM